MPLDLMIFSEVSQHAPLNQSSPPKDQPLTPQNEKFPQYLNNRGDLNNRAEVSVFSISGGGDLILAGSD